MCSLTPLYLYLAADGELRLSEFGLSRWDGTISCRLHDNLLKLRWMAPEVIEKLYITKHAEVLVSGLLYDILFVAIGIINSPSVAS